jgi:hypothetical protein
VAFNLVILETLGTPLSMDQVRKYFFSWSLIKTLLDVINQRHSFPFHE